MNQAGKDLKFLENPASTTRRSRSTRNDKSVARISHENDCRIVENVLEKKRAQNRIAQRKYRLNIKRRISELEQRVTAQATRLAEAGEEQVTPTHMQSLQRTAIYRENFLRRQASPTNAKVSPCNPALVPSELDTFNGSNKNPRTGAEKGTGHTESIDTRITHLIQFTRMIGFQDLDEAIAAYYTENFDANSTSACSQRLSRNQRLPKLLEKLQSSSDLWTPEESRSLSNAIMKSAENILSSEVQRFLDEWDLAEFCQLSEITDQDWAYLCCEFRRELPGLCSMISKLLEHNQNLPTQQSRLIRVIVSLLYAG